MRYRRPPERAARHRVAVYREGWGPWRQMGGAGGVVIGPMRDWVAIGG